MSNEKLSKLRALVERWQSQGTSLGPFPSLGIQHADELSAILNEPEEAEPVAIPEGWKLVPKDFRKLAPHAWKPFQEIRNGNWSEDVAWEELLATAPQPEPVAWMRVTEKYKFFYADPREIAFQLIPLYTAPPELESLRAENARLAAELAKAREETQR